MLSPLVEVLNNMRVILATSSKQRIDIFKKTPIKFEIKTSDFEENLDRNKYTFSEYVELTALGKVQKVYEQLKNDDKPPDLIIGLDTMICCDNYFFGKPKDKDDAIQIIRRLSSGSPHTCLTGVAIFYKGRYTKFCESTTIFMESLTDAEILSYVESGESMYFLY
nr:uncharacterized protein LOC111423442 [Onthophagus taurus]